MVQNYLQRTGRGEWANQVILMLFFIFFRFSYFVFSSVIPLFLLITLLIAPIWINCDTIHRLFRVLVFTNVFVLFVE